MEIQGSIGGLIPLWILGAPFVAGLLAWMTAPKTTTYRDADTRSGYTGAPVAGPTGMR